MDITDHKSRLEDLTRHVMEYLDTRWDLLVLEITEKGLAAASSIVTGLILTVFGGIILVFVSIGTAIWIGQRMHNPIAGYFIIAGFFVVLLVLVLAFAYNYVRTVVANAVLESIKDDEEDEKTS
jgi:Putative Actinobacterial Holin-X, holin superfamily III